MGQPLAQVGRSRPLIQLATTYACEHLNIRTGGYAINSHDSLCMGEWSTCRAPEIACILLVQGKDTSGWHTETLPARLGNLQSRVKPYGRGSLGRRI